MKKIVSRDWLIDKLNNHHDKAKLVGRALLVIFKNQTNDEKQVNITRNHNCIGFTPADARQGSIHAKYFIKHGTLQDWMIDIWVKCNSKDVPRIAKYHAQLNQAANKKDN